MNVLISWEQMQKEHEAKERAEYNQKRNGKFSGEWKDEGSSWMSGEDYSKKDTGANDVPHAEEY